MYGGELAPGGPPSVVPGLQLIPIVQMQGVLQKMLPVVETPSEWPAILDTITSGPFATLEFKKIFNAYAGSLAPSLGAAPRCHAARLHRVVQTISTTPRGAPRRMRTCSAAPRPLPSRRRRQPSPSPLCLLDQCVRLLSYALSSLPSQYLLRNEALKQLSELADEIRYQLKQEPAKQETDIALEYLQVRQWGHTVPSRMFD